MVNIYFVLLSFVYPWSAHCRYTNIVLFSFVVNTAIVYGQFNIKKILVILH